MVLLSRTYASISKEIRYVSHVFKVEGKECDNLCWYRHNFYHPQVKDVISIWEVKKRNKVKVGWINRIGLIDSWQFANKLRKEVLSDVPTEFRKMNQNRCKLVVSRILIFIRDKPSTYAHLLCKKSTVVYFKALWLCIHMQNEVLKKIAVLRSH